MCGINGIVALRPGPRFAADMRHRVGVMNHAIAHRGPDGEGCYLDGEHVALGHRRLSIVDLSDAGHQPMFNEDYTLSLVFNGEIYNYRELIPELQARGHVFRSRSDSEVILHSYEEWGEDCVQRFNGMWAFALWDARLKRLFASRDRFGVKPFVCTEHEGDLIFSSELAGLRAVAPLHEANLGKLHDYLAYGYRTNNGDTFLAGVRELPPAHNLVVQAGRVRLQRYWSLPEERSPQAPQGAAAAEAIRELLADAVRLRFRSDVPVALLQSGGLDSSAICAVVNDEIDRGRLGVDSVTGFTAVHPGHPFDESQAVRTLMATCPHVRSVEIEPPGDELASQLPAFARAMQEPMFSSTSFAHWALMKSIRAEGTKVVINGQGSDEALAGYGHFIVGYRLLDLMLTRPSRAAQEFMQMRRVMGVSCAHLAAQTAKAMLGRRAASAWRSRISEGTHGVLSPEFRRQHRDYLPAKPMTWAPGNLDAHLRSQLQHFGFNQILNYEDQSSMSHSIEIRSPFIDYRLMEFAFSQPDDAKLSGGITKRLLREAFATRLPPSIVNQHRKIGFATPFEKWSATPSFRQFVAELVATPEFRSRTIWDPRRLAARLTDPDAVAKGFPAWRFLMAELWMREFGVTNG
jgi:asparagine synthase (glutamine-hydrolysing)